MYNAGSHRIDNEDKDCTEAVRNSGLNIKIINQPSNSPDLNVLDLGYFNSIQSLQQQSKMTTIDKLVSCVVDSFNNLSMRPLHNIWITWQLVMLQIILSDGDNTYVLPHKNKCLLERDGLIKTNVVISEDIVQKIKDTPDLNNQKLINCYFRMKTRSLSKCLIRV